MKLPRASTVSREEAYLNMRHNTQMSIVRIKMPILCEKRKKKRKKIQKNCEQCSHMHFWTSKLISIKN